MIPGRAAVPVVLPAGVLLAHLPVNIFVQIGLVVLVGLACKNAILIVEFAKQLHQEGKPRLDATVEASRLRLRPILMTSFAFILGVFPSSWPRGPGSREHASLSAGDGGIFAGMFGGRWSASSRRPCSST